MSRDVRLIVHKTGTSLLLCYVNHHDEAYQWAERRKVETHPKTGAAQLVEIRERVQEIAIPKYVEVEAKPKEEAYRDVTRLGRKTRLKEPQRALLWSIFEDVRSRLRSKGVITYSGLFNRLASHFEGGAHSPFDFVVVDEAQDVSIAQLRFLAATHPKTGAAQLVEIRERVQEIAIPKYVEVEAKPKEEAYRDVARLGSKTRLKEPQRALLWSIFEDVRSRLRSKGLITYSGLFNRLASHFEGGAHSPFDFVVVDEAQDVSIAQLRFLAALSGGRPNKLFFAGDLGQRIFQQPFSWKALGVDVRGRSTTLRINYRTSHYGNNEISCGNSYSILYGAYDCNQRRAVNRTIESVRTRSRSRKRGSRCQRGCPPRPAANPQGEMPRPPPQ